MLRNVHYSSEGPSKRANLENELDDVDIARCFIDFGDFNSQPCGRTGGHVLMPDVRTWRKNAGSPLFVSSIDGARLSECFRGLATIYAMKPVSGVQHRPVKLVIHASLSLRGVTLGFTCWLGVLPSLHVSCVSAHGLPGWGSGSESERVARLWRRHRQARARKTGENDCRADAILEEISHILSGKLQGGYRQMERCHEKPWSRCSLGQEPIHCWSQPAASCELGR